jgi:hypothetical protein
MADYRALHRQRRRPPATRDFHPCVAAQALQDHGGFRLGMMQPLPEIAPQVFPHRLNVLRSFQLLGIRRRTDPQGCPPVLGLS